MSLKLKTIDNVRFKVVIIEENKNISVGNISLNTNNLTVQKFVLKDDTSSLEIYAPDGVTLVAKIDSLGNIGLKGQIYSL